MPDDELQFQPIDPAALDEAPAPHAALTPLDEGFDEDAVRATLAGDLEGPSAPVIDAARILADRPDVYRAFFDEYYGPNNDHHSGAWAQRVGEATPEAYALYWYKTFGQYGAYQPAAFPSEPDPERMAALMGATDGRTTDDGILLSKILADRPDVYRAFFTEYYGRYNDHHSSAWMDRVGGATPEDYANYWYKTYGKAAGYTPSEPQPVFNPGPENPDHEVPPPPVDPTPEIVDDGLSEPVTLVTADPPATDGGQFVF